MKRIVFFLFIVLLSVYGARASHIAGCDLSYTCIGGNDYLITLSFYRDCSGIDEPTTVNVNFTSGCGTFTVTLNKIAPINGVEVTPVCPGQVTTCNGGSLYGLQKFVYQGQVTLQPCADWTMSYTLCCRNQSNTISNSTSADMYIPATLNNLAAPCNSSPTFSNPPSTIICNGQQFCFNHGAIDPDGDSLVYTLVTPYDDGPGGAQPNVTYLGGYSAQQPLPSSPPVVIDPLNGDICMTPTTNITTVLAVLVQEYRWIGGVPVLIGSVLRDMQLTVVTCNNQLPTLGGITDTASQYYPTDTIYDYQLCLSDTVLFNIFSFDPDVSNHLTMTWNQGIPDGTFTVTGNGTNAPVGHFFWVPAGGTVSNVPYCFTVNISDDNCPYVGTQTFSYCLTVQGINIDLNLPPDTLLCMGEAITLVGLGDTNCVNYYWTVDGNTVTPINDSTYLFQTTSWPPGIHNVVLSVDNGILTQCPGSDYLNVHIIPQPNISLGPDDTVCSGQLLTLDAGPGGGGYYWYPGGETTQTITVNTDTSSYSAYIVEVDGGLNTRCKDYDTVFIKVLQLPIVDLGPDLCLTHDTLLSAGNTGFQFLWEDENGTIIGNAQSQFISSSGTYYLTVAEQLDKGCDVTDDIYIKIIPEPQITLGPDSTVCQHESTKLEVKGVNIDLTQYNYAYSWYPTLETTPYTVQAYLPEGVHQFVCAVTGCTTVSDTINLTVNICPLDIPNVFTPNDDNWNQTFKITNLEFYPNSTLVVYNRWGRKVYESTNYQNDWDGEKCSDGVYYYILRINYGNTGNGERIEESRGTVTLLR
jgi:gliding motility-associated-like protein